MILVLSNPVHGVRLAAKSLILCLPTHLGNMIWLSLFPRPATPTREYPLLLPGRAAVQSSCFFLRIPHLHLCHRIKAKCYQVAMATAGPNDNYLTWSGLFAATHHSERATLTKPQSFQGQTDSVGTARYRREWGLELGDCFHSLSKAP